ncbi:hypothetical protein KC19_11G051100 [Ceratodon purpureus]|uniref:Ubiquitin receptor RAD23 n=1 Tax=Ceratodon purpureus TaxID=3225 RepID=A0A8T0GB73_CERPU|nr:hypothetical protein KC19_11G051100 [Ceratodon purpureus]
MKISVKTLKGNHFDLQVAEDELVSSVKAKIEESQGKEAFPCAQQLLIHQGKVLKDDTTMADNKVAENGFLVVMLTKTKAPAAPGAGGASGSAQAPAPAAPAPTPAPAPAAAPAPAPVAAPAPPAAPAPGTGDGYGHAASNLVAGSALEQTVQQIIDMGGGTWDRDTVLRALRAAFNNPERAVEYLYSGIPEAAEVPAPGARPPPAAAPAAAIPAAAAPAAPAAPAGPNAAPLDLFPQGMPGVAGGGAGLGALDFLRNNPQFQALRTMVQANPQILQPMLQELGKQNPALLRLINDNQAEFLRLINEAGAEGVEGDAMGQLAGAYPQSVNVTPEERESIERLEAMGFNRALVIEAFLACDKNEQLAANYLLEHAGDYEDL